ncbi:MAG: GAF domain-containing sensor histidine kinase, partial [bacterium]|nr:GAF domain-containing sensor histidine kinase [bacterium]
EESEALYRVSKAINAATTYEQIVQAVAPIDAEANEVSLRLWQYQENQLTNMAEVIVGRRSFDDPDADLSVQHSTKAFTPTLMHMIDEPLWVFEDIRIDPRLDAATQEIWVSAGRVALIDVLLEQDGPPLGSLAFFSEKPRRYTRREIRLIQGAGDLVTAAVQRIRLQQETDASRRRAELLAEMNARLSGAASDQAILDAVALLAEQHGAWQAGLSYLDEEDRTDLCVYSAGFRKDGEARPHDLPREPFPLRDHPLVRLAYAHPHAPIFIEDPLNDDRPEIQESVERARRNFPAQPPPVVLLPLMTGSRWHGLIHFYFPVGQKFTRELRDLFHAVQPAVAAVVATRRAYLAEEEARQESEFLYRVSAAINSATTYQEIVEALVNVDGGSQGVMLSLWDHDDYHKAEYVEIVAASSNDPAIRLPPPGKRLHKSTLPIAERMVHEPLWMFEDIHTDPRVDPVTRKSWDALATRALIGPSLIHEGRWIGGPTFHSAVPRRYTARDIRLAKGVGDLVLAAVQRIRLQRETEISRRRAETLAEINAKLSQAQSEDDILGAVAQLAKDYGASFSLLAYAEPSAHGVPEEVRVVAGRTGEGDILPPATFGRSHYNLSEFPLLQLAFLQPHVPIFVEDIHTDTRPDAVMGREAAGDFDLPASLLIPLQTGSQWQGMLNIFWNTPQQFSAEMRDLFTAIQPAVSAVVASRRAYLAERQRAQQLSIVAEVSKAAASVLDESDLLDTVARLSRHNFPNDDVFVYLLDADEATLTQTMQGNHPLGRSTIRLDDAHSPIARAARTRQGVIVSDLALNSDLTLTPSVHEARSEIAVPMVANENLIGVLDVQSREENHFNEADLRVLSTLADLLAIAVQNARLYVQAQELAVLEERGRLARELHDSVSQAIYGIALGTRTARMLLQKDPSRLAEPLDYVMALAEGGLSEMRALIFDLRPESLEEEGLMTALHKQADVLQTRHNIAVKLAYEDGLELKLEYQAALYRIGREALHNIIKHAYASSVELRVFAEWQNGQRCGVVMDIIDNGRGFDPDRSYTGHLGLISMRDRADKLNGVCEISSKPGQGTHLRVLFPAAAFSYP